VKELPQLSGPGLRGIYSIMWPRLPRTVALTIVIGSAVAAAWCGGSPASPTPSVAVTPGPGEAPPVNGSPVETAPAPLPTNPGSTWINIFGDTGWCGSPGMRPVARMLAELGGDVFLAGDLAYDNGTIEEFQRCFDPDFGRFKSRSWAAPGNHDYQTPNANGYFNYFGDRAGPNRLGYYAVRSSAWKVLMLNSNVPIGRGTAQLEFVRQELQRDPARCTLAVMHHPFDSSGPNGPSPALRDLWELMYDAGVDLVVAGHDHLYERHAPMDASLKADPVRGIRLLIAGTGGAALYGTARAAVNSEFRVSVYGLLRLHLEPALYEWEFRDQNGAIRDNGLNICH